MPNVPIMPLLEPIKIRGLQLSNRILMSPVVRAVEPDGIPRDVTPPQTINNTDDIVRRYEGGEFDLLAAGRPLVNDPMWAHCACAQEDFLPFNGKCLSPRYVE